MGQDTRALVEAFVAEKGVTQCPDGNVTYNPSSRAVRSEEVGTVVSIERVTLAKPRKGFDNRSKAADIVRIKIRGRLNDVYLLCPPKWSGQSKLEIGCAYKFSLVQIKGHIGLQPQAQTNNAGAAESGEPNTVEVVSVNIHAQVNKKPSFRRGRVVKPSDRREGGSFAPDIG